MKILRDPVRTDACVLVLGMFDGVHRGHQALLMQGVALAQEKGVPLNVCTFEPHPLAVLRPEAAPPRLTTQTERAQLMAGFGVDSLCVVSFTRAIADQAPEDFMAQMVEVFSPQVVVCGFNFTFGRRGKGTGEMLRAYGVAHGFETVIVPEVVLDGATVSSTRIRGLLDAGQLREAGWLMGHAYTLSGRALSRPGAARGCTLNVPRGKALPAPGVYACYLTVDRQNYPALAVLIHGGDTVQVRMLAGLLVLDGRRVRLTFMQRLRGPEAEGADVRQREAQDEAMGREYFFDQL